MFIYYGEDVNHFIVASYSYMARYPDEFNRIAFPYSFFVKIRLIISLFDSIFSTAIIALSASTICW